MRIINSQPGFALKTVQTQKFAQFELVFILEPVLHTISVVCDSMAVVLEQTFTWQRCHGAREARIALSGERKPLDLNVWEICGEIVVQRRSRDCYRWHFASLDLICVQIFKGLRLFPLKMNLLVRFGFFFFCIFCFFFVSEYWMRTSCMKDTSSSTE